MQTGPETKGIACAGRAAQQGQPDGRTPFLGVLENRSRSEQARESEAELIALFGCCAKTNQKTDRSNLLIALWLFNIQGRGLRNRKCDMTTELNNKK